MAEESVRERQRQRPNSNPRRTAATSEGLSDGCAPRNPGKPPGSGGASGASRSVAWKSLAALAGLAAIAVAGFVMFPDGSAVDSVAEADAQSRTLAYEALLASPGFALDLVAPDDVDAAIASFPENVSEQQRDQLRSDLNQGRVKLAWLTLWDTHAEDGDILRLESSSSFPIEVTALNTKTTIAIPYPADGNVRVTGVRDGGGGITIALESGSAHIDWPTMAPGDTLNLPVTQGF